jgi:hypothetical protein
MPSFKTYRDDKNIYSVDMMLAYVNSHKHSVIKLKIEELIPQLEANIWGGMVADDCPQENGCEKIR